MKGRRSPRPAWQPVDGLLLLDKPRGISSNQALQRARHLFRAAKAGHTGSLDPLATGLLPICFGEATKIAGLLLGSRKAYRVEARLGVTTDTEDADGEAVLERPVPALSKADVETRLPPLTGTILQRPPAYSALKRDGVPAYRRARAGEDFELEPRQVEVHGIQLLRLDGELLELEVECGSGTYIRSLVRDLGEALGCGAHVTALRRLWVEPFRAPVMHTLESLAAADPAERPTFLLPLESGLRHLPGLSVDAERAVRLRQGQRVPLDAPPGEYILWVGDRAMGRGRVDAESVLHPDRLFNSPPEA
ncbi:tRNA pseudouridine(55) synthase TruB [Pseudomarimonas salicorniae]|uniref:tRNA pseudouridine synthase B n=1 Tax=Pseudomarimonas salicorniae TaxID=2933270 RepID=A0ABT0GFH3_9GAMM|nr:tRNA pseudouridine(55) synthase TruB [Lysobacter sp. CAU 1642]MCK7593285.1 tRNA pseudouridine(55) synthase TruB [Lysobacter sp. CAU 1642]